MTMETADEDGRERRRGCRGGRQMMTARTERSTADDDHEDGEEDGR